MKDWTGVVRLCFNGWPPRIPRDGASYSHPRGECMVDEPEKESTPVSQPYDPPRVDQVIGADELAREVHYAGVIGPSPITPG